MNSALGWLGQLMEKLLSLIPELVIIRATHMGIKWRWGKKVIQLSPGVHIYWPIVSEVMLYVVARQTYNLPTQALITKDGKQIVIGPVIVCNISDVIKAYGETNWDIGSTIKDITQSTVVRVITGMTLKEIQGGLAEGKRSKLNLLLTNTARKELKPFGVNIQRCCITDFSTCTVYKKYGGDFIGDHDEDE